MRRQIKVENEENEVIILSGGAEGSDTLFGNIKGTVCYHFSFEGHKASEPLNGKIIKIPRIKLLRRKQELNEVLKYMGRDYNFNSIFVENLLLRNMFQIKNNLYKSQLCIAIADVFKDNVSGGTNYAVIKAILEKIPVYVLDKSTNKWYNYNYDKNYFCLVEHSFPLKDIKVLTGIGSRDITMTNVSKIMEIFTTGSICN